MPSGGITMATINTLRINESDTTMKKTKSGSMEGKGADSPSQLVDARINELNDWRGNLLARIRKLIHEADPEVVEEVKWRKPSNSMAGVPVWSHDGIICTGETYKNVVKMTFAKGARLADPSGLFNSSLEGNTRRAIDFHEGDKIDEQALKALIRAAVLVNAAAPASAAPGALGGNPRARERGSEPSTRHTFAGVDRPSPSLRDHSYRPPLGRLGVGRARLLPPFEGGGFWSMGFVNPGWAVDGRPWANGCNCFAVSEQARRVNLKGSQQ